MYEYCECYIYDLTPLRISDIENQKGMIFIAVCVHCTLPKVRLTLVLRPSCEHTIKL